MQLFTNSCDSCMEDTGSEVSFQCSVVVVNFPSIETVTVSLQPLFGGATKIRLTFEMFYCAENSFDIKMTGLILFASELLEQGCPC